MILEELELHQVCQYEHFVHKFHPGTTGIFGPNGAGKSNFVKMAWASLTGDFSVNAGVKEDNVRWNMPKGEYSAITSKWVHEGKRFTIRRALANTNNFLRMEGSDKELRGAKEINAKIEEILGVSKSYLEFLFVRQWKIFDFLSAIPSQRAAIFARLCEADIAEKAYRALTETIKTDQALVATVLDNREDIRQQIINRKARIRELQENKAELQAKVLKKSQGEQYEQMVKAADRKALLESQLADIEQRIVDLDVESGYAIEELNYATKQYQTQQTSVESLAKKASKAERALENYAKYRKRKHRIESLQSIIDIKEVPAPPKPKEYADYETHKQTLADANAIHGNCLTILENFEETGVVDCPTCGTAAENLEEHLEQVREQMEDALKRIRSLREIVQSCQNYERSWAAWSKQDTIDKARKQSAKDELKSLLADDDDVKEIDEAALKKVLADYEEAQEVLAGYKRRYDKAVAAEAKLTNELEFLEGEQAKLQVDIDNLKVKPGDAVKARKALDDHRNARADLRTVDARIEDLEDLNQVDEEAIVQIKELMDRSQEGRKWLDDLEYMRDICHREKLPKLASQRWLEKLTVKINKTLEDFDSPFYVEADEDLSFIAVKPSGRRERADRLSGGEMVLLAIAFRFAVNSLIAGKTGMLILDEPTAGVDSTNIDNLADVLKKVSEATKRNGQQLIIITHDDRLERAFDDVVYIGKAP